MIGIGLAATGVPYWAFLSLATAAFGLFPDWRNGPGLGPGYALPGVGHGWVRALILLGWCAVSVAVIDNLIKPQLTGRGTGLPTLALFLGIAGGLRPTASPGCLPVPR